LAPSSAAGTPPANDLATQAYALAGEEGPITAHVVDTGEGRPVVFLHGLVGLNDHWENVVRRARHRVRCVMLEMPLLSLRGGDCNIEGVTNLTAEFLERHLGEPAVLVGNSFGGHVALRLALEHARLVQGLVLAGSSGMIEKSIVSDVQIRPSRDWLSRKIGELFFDQSNMREADLDRAHKELSDRGGARAMVKLSRSARRNHLGDRIGDIDVPCLLIWGKQDIVTPPEAAAEFKRLLRNARITWIDRCGHAPMIEKPAEFADALLKFADELDRRDASR